MKRAPWNERQWDEKVEEIKKLYAKGLSIAKIVKNQRGIKFSASTIRRLLKGYRPKNFLPADKIKVEKKAKPKVNVKKAKKLAPVWRQDFPVNEELIFHEEPKPIPTNKDIKKEIMALIDQFLAIETLEYHDKNHLSGDNKTRSEMKMALLARCLRLIREDEK